MRKNLVEEVFIRSLQFFSHKLINKKISSPIKGKNIKNFLPDGWSCHPDDLGEIMVTPQVTNKKTGS